MTTFITRVTFDHIRNTAAGFTADNPVLGYGVIGIETDTGRSKIGDGQTAWVALIYSKSPVDAHTHAPAEVGLGNVDNTADASKPVSTAQAAADAAVASAAAADATSKASAAQAHAIQRANHTGTQAISTVSGLQTALDSKQPAGSYAAASHGHAIGEVTGLQAALDAKATPSDVTAAVAAVVDAAPAALDTLNELAAALGDDANFASTVTTALAGKVDSTDGRLTDAREWTADTVSQAEAEAGTAATRRAWTALRVFQSVASWWAGSNAKTKLDGIATGATANQSDSYLLSRANHTGTQTAETISDFSAAAAAAAPVQSVAGKAGTVTLSKADVGLGNVDNTADASKPVSTAQAAADAAVASAAAADATSKANAAQAHAIQRANHTGTQAISTVSGLQDALDSKQPAGSYAALVDGKVPSDQLPSYVDDVVEYANSAAFPASGEAGKIYVAINTAKGYRWSGSVYVEVSPSEVTSVAGKTGAVTLVKADVGLANVDNTSDANKPVSTAVSQALAGKVDTTDGRMADAREWIAETVSQAEAQAGTGTTRRAWTALRVFQSVAAWWAASAAKAKLDGIATGATANATDAQLRDRSSHTGTQAIETISGLEQALSAKQPTLAAGTDGYVLTYIGGQWVASQAFSAGSGNQAGDVLAWNTTSNAYEPVQVSTLLPSASDGDVLTFDAAAGVWIAAAPTGGGGGGGGSGLPSSPNDGALTVYSSTAMSWTTSGDSMYLSEVVLGAFGNGSSNRSIVSFTPSDSGGPSIKVYDSMGMAFTELMSTGIKFADGSTQGSAFGGGYSGNISIYDGSTYHNFEFSNGVLTNYYT